MSERKLRYTITNETVTAVPRVRNDERSTWVLFADGEMAQVWNGHLAPYEETNKETSKHNVREIEGTYSLDGKHAPLIGGRYMDEDMVIGVRYRITIEEILQNEETQGL